MLLCSCSRSICSLVGSSSSFPAGLDNCRGLGRWGTKVKRKKGQRELNSAVPSPSWCRGTPLPYLCQQVRNSAVMYFCVHLGLSLFWLPGCGEYRQPCWLFLLLPFVVNPCPLECPSAWKGAAEATRGAFCRNLEQAIRTTWCMYFVRPVSINTSLLRV